MSSPTASFLKNRAAYNSSIVTGKWQSNFYASYTYAIDNGIPFIAVWSNGDACGHCTIFESACNSTVFKQWMKSSGIVFYFTYSGDKGDGTTKKSGKKADNGKIGSDIFHWVRANKNTGYPFVRIYWPKGKVDVATIGDTVDGNRDGAPGGENAIKYFKKVLKDFKPSSPGQTPEITDQIVIQVNATSKWATPAASQSFVDYVRGYTDGYTG